MNDATVALPQSDELLDVVDRRQREFVHQTAETSRKRIGQFFTPPAVARFMARLFLRPLHRFRLRDPGDPGAGLGILTAAACQRYLRLGTPRVLEVHLYENDSATIDGLRATMDDCRREMHRNGHDFQAHLHEADY